MHYNVEDIQNPLRTFSRRYDMPLWQYVVQPRTYYADPYISRLDFQEPLLNEFLAYYAPKDGDVLEVFALTKRVLVVMLQVDVKTPADVVIQPVTHYNIQFDQVDCNIAGPHDLLVGGGVPGPTINLAQSAILVDDPDYLGFKIISGAENLSDLVIDFTLSVQDEYPWWATTNSLKDARQ